MPTYFVTGATGFIGRHLVERLLARDGERAVTTPLAEANPRARAPRLGGEAGAARRQRADPRGHRRPGRAVPRPRRGAARRAARERRPLLPPRRDLRHDRGRDRERAAQRRRDAARDRPRQRPRGGDLPPRLVDRRGRQLRGPLHRGHVRRGPEAALAVPPDEVRVGEARPRPRERGLARVPPVDRRRRLAHGRDGQDRRPVLLLQGDPEGAPRAARVVPAHRARGRLDQHRPGRLRRRRDRPHRARAGPRRPGVPPRQPAPAARRRRAQHVRPRRPRPADGDPRRQADDRHAAEGRPVLRDEAAGAEGHPAHAARRPRDPRHGDRAHGARPALRRPRRPARAARLGDRGPGARDLLEPSCGTSGSATSTPTCSRTARSAPRSTGARC